MFCRRIRRSEHSQLQDLCTNDERWRQYYLSHGTWLSKAFQEISSLQDRVVIGYFNPLIKGGDNLSSELTGCIFLKKSKFENSIELKNFVFPKKNYETVQKMLIEKAVRFCEIRNIEKTEVELPQEEHELISVFLQSGFRIVSIREKYRSTMSVCILEKYNGDIYYGDPFDQKLFAQWLLNQYLPCNVIAKGYSNTLFRFFFNSKTSLKAFSDENAEGYDKRLKGIMWILSHAENEIQEDHINYIIENSKNQILRLIYVDKLNEKIKRKLLKNNFNLFEKKEMLPIAGGDRSSMSTPINFDEIGGVVTVLEYEEIVSRSEEPTTTYYLFSGINAGLQIEGDGPQKILAIYCPNWKSKSGIVGYFEIIAIEKPLFKNLLLRKLPKDSMLSMEDLKFYQLYSEDETVAVLSCKKLILLDTPLSLEDSTWIEDQKVKEYLIKEIIHNGNNSTYLDLSSCSSIKEAPQKLYEQIFQGIKNKEIMIETIAAAIAIIADSIDIAGFTKKHIMLLQSRIAQNKEGEKTIQSSRVRSLIEGHIAQLDELIADYKNALKNKGASSLNKQDYCKMISYQAISILDKIKPFKSSFPEYDDLVLFFDAATK